MISSGRSSSHRRRASQGAFTLIELLVVIAIIMLLAALALPVLQQSTQIARGAQCVSNVRQLAVAFRNYANQHKGRLTGAQGGCQPDAQPTWLFHLDPDHDASNENETVFADVPTRGQLYSFYRDPGLVLCPSDRKGNGKFSYSMPQQTAFKIMDNVENAVTATLVIAEHPLYNIGGYPPKGGRRREGGFGCSDRPAGRHNGKTGEGFFDGHATLTDYPAGKTATEFVIDPWGNACGWWE